MDQFLRAKQEKFIKEGGFKENLYQKLQEYKQSFSSSKTNH